MIDLKHAAIKATVDGHEVVHLVEVHTGCYSIGAQNQNYDEEIANVENLLTLLDFGVSFVLIHSKI